MFAPTQRTRRFFDAHIASHLTLTAADAARAEEEEREREARGLRPRVAGRRERGGSALLQPVFR